MGQIADAACAVAGSCYNINKCTRGTELVFNESMKKVRWGGVSLGLQHWAGHAGTDWRFPGAHWQDLWVSSLVKDTVSK